MSNRTGFQLVLCFKIIIAESNLAAAYTKHLEQKLFFPRRVISDG